MMIFGHGLFAWLNMGLGLVIHIAFALMVVLSAIWLYKKVMSGKEVTNKPASAIEILRQRLAKGEICLEEYHALRKELE